MGRRRTCVFGYYPFVTRTSTLSIVRAAIAISLFPCRAAAQDDACAPPTHDLYCIDLTATARGGAATGTVALNYIPGPFTVPLTVDGYYRYAPRITVRDLPAPAAGTRYVAWAATPTMDVIRRLGAVTNGVNEGRELALDRFLILISAERDSAAPEPKGPILLRGESP